MSDAPARIRLSRGPRGGWLLPVGFDDPNMKDGELYIRANLASRWQPIETAPRDGSPVLSGFDCALDGEIDRCAHVLAVAFWCEETGNWRSFGSNPDSDPLYLQPTHWMPLLAIWPEEALSLGDSDG